MVSYSKLTNKHKAMIVSAIDYQQFIIVFMFLHMIYNIGTTTKAKAKLSAVTQLAIATQH